MRVTMHQPEHLPWLGFFHKMAQADMYVVMDTVQYRHQYFQNRNLLLGPGGPLWVTVPVRKCAHRHGPIGEVLIDNTRAWRKTYWGSIRHHYGKHPHFHRYAEALEALVTAPTDSLLAFNMALIGFFREALDIDTPMVLASSLDARGQKAELIRHLCRQLGARTYLSGPWGRTYLDEAAFAEYAIEVQYQKFIHPAYPQRGRAGFTPQLSTLDLLMNCGPDSRRILLQGLEAPAEPMLQLAG